MIIQRVNLNIRLCNGNTAVWLRIAHYHSAVLSTMNVWKLKFEQALQLWAAFICLSVKKPFGDRFMSRSTSSSVIPQTQHQQLEHRAFSAISKSKKIGFVFVTLFNVPDGTKKRFEKTAPNEVTAVVYVVLDVVSIHTGIDSEQ
jgi:hypothetical protein